MKKKIIKAVLFTILSTGIISGSTVYAQSGNPPPPPGEHGSQENLPPGGGTPVGSGIVILLALGAVYGGKKVNEVWKKQIANTPKQQS